MTSMGADSDRTDVPNKWTGVSRGQGHIYQAGRDVLVVKQEAREESRVRALPRDTPAFTGRENELAELLACVADTSRRASIVAISAIDGMAGIGKTTLAVHAGHHLSLEYPDAQFFVNLHGHTPEIEPLEPGDVLVGLLAEMGVDPQHIPVDTDGKASMWRTRTADKRILLILDDALNSDQVIPLLPGSDSSCVLVTSRRRLTDLTTRYAAASLPLDILPREQAVKLLIRVAGRTPQPSETGAIDAILRSCGFLPLAICLAASKLVHHPTWTFLDLSAEIETAHDGLSLFSSDTGSVAAAFHMSYRDLPRARQLFFRRLALSPGPDIEACAAAAVAGTSLMTSRAQLDALYNDHLLQETSRGRYRMHDIVRGYAKFIASDERSVGRQRAVKRLLAHYEFEAANAAARLARAGGTNALYQQVSGRSTTASKGTRADALQWLNAERSNLLACARYAESTGDMSRVCRFADILNDFLLEAGLWDEAETLHEAAVRAANRDEDRARALGNLGWVRFLKGDCAAADEALNSACTTFEETRSELGRAETLVKRGRLRWLLGDYEDATADLTLAKDLYGASGDHKAGEADALNNLGAVLRETASYRAAVEALETALRMFKDIDDLHGEAEALQNLGATLRFMGDYPPAQAALERSLALSRSLASRHGEAVALTYLGAVLQETGDLHGAWASCEASLAINREIGSRHGEAETLVKLASIARLTDRDREAIAMARAGLAVYQALGSQLGAADALNELGAALCSAGNHADAEPVLRDALSIYAGVGNRHGEAEVLNHLGSTLRHQLKDEAALDVHLQALAASRQAGSPVEEARSMEGAARCWIQLGQRARASEFLDAATAIYARVAPSELARIRLLADSIV
jgi:tetratricopeptide (TPR) repeat protein